MSGIVSLVSVDFERKVLFGNRGAIACFTHQNRPKEPAAAAKRNATQPRTAVAEQDLTGLRQWCWIYKAILELGPKRGSWVDCPRSLVLLVHLPCHPNVDLEHAMEGLSLLHRLLRECASFYNEGNCRYGENCKFLHSASQEELDRSIESVVQGQGAAVIEQATRHSGRWIPRPSGEELLNPRTRTPGHYQCWGHRVNTQQKCRSNQVLVPLSQGFRTQERIRHRYKLEGRRKQTKPCFAFQGNGQCKKGDSCPYSHAIKIERPNWQGTASTQGGISPQPAASFQQLGGATQEAPTKRRGDDERRRQAEELRRMMEEKLERERLERERVQSALEERERAERSIWRGSVWRGNVWRGNVWKESVWKESVWKRASGKRASVEHLERMRRERERLERQRLETERLERERLERKRLEAETLERQMAEAERVAREKEAAAARRAEAKERKKREREEKLARERDAKLARERERLLREQEAKRRREAMVTLQFVVQGSNLVTFGPGLAVQSVVPGFDLCKVIVRNLPTNATDKEVTNIFKDQGVDEKMCKLLELRDERGRKRRRYWQDRTDLELRDNVLAIEVEGNTAWGSMRSSASGTDPNTLTFFWHSPSVVMIATYETVEEARRKARALDRRKVNGRTITAILNPRPNGAAAMYWVEESVKLGNLAPGTTPADVEIIAETTNVRPIKSNNYDHASFLDHLELCLRVDAELQAGPGRMKGTARFPSQVSLSRAAQRLSRGWNTGTWPRIYVSEQHHYTITISNAQYHAQKAQWDSMTETARGKKAFVRINERRNGYAFVNVEGSEEKEVGELKVRVENLVAGERLGVEHWHRSYAYSGKTLFDRVMEEAEVLVTVDRRLQALRLFGASAGLLQAKDIIRQDIERLELMEYTIPIERRSVRFFVATGLPILQEALGEDNVSLDVGSHQCNLKLRGGDDAIKHAQRLVEEAVNAARSGIHAPDQAADDEAAVIPAANRASATTYPPAATSDNFPLVCMGNNAACNTPISVPIIHRYLTQQRFTILVDAVFSSYIQSNSQKFKYCTTPDCTQIYQCDTNKQFHQCPACFSRICSSCNEDAHEGMTCEERRIQSNPAEQDRLNNLWFQANNDATICRANAVPTGAGSAEGAFARDAIYAHMRAAHGGIGLPGDPVTIPHVAVVGIARERNGRGGDDLAELNLGGRAIFKHCPVCDVLTDKDGGGNHMTCRCGTHWCWVCRGVFERTTIYGHLMATHGGLGFTRGWPYCCDCTGEASDSRGVSQNPTTAQDR
ncbi:hypothetical protein FA13DRAFT_1711217 [Coprinellus micaceus]|uniref:RBR-type E3 ubiquitin transferase n=1 Tax=Coprinellus micaceus TaxID=71717 RepID=A0A4Y7T5J5_COPMI|nr:hypothetical protein FA13DRAFT_1711217 [Coprinellus micaceus]